MPKTRSLVPKVPVPTFLVPKVLVPRVPLVLVPKFLFGNAPACEAPLRLIYATLVLILSSLLTACISVQEDKQHLQDDLLPMPIALEPGPDIAPWESSEGDIMAISVNHKVGSIGFTINAKHYFYYMSGGAEHEKILATSQIIEDIQRAEYIDIQSEEHGMHRRITNMQLFYGDDTTIRRISSKP